MFQTFYNLALSPKLDRFVFASCYQIKSEFLIGKKMNVVDKRIVLDRIEFFFFRNWPNLARLVVTTTRNSISVDTDWQNTISMFIILKKLLFPIRNNSPKPNFRWGQKRLHFPHIHQLQHVNLTISTPLFFLQIYDRPLSISPAQDRVCGVGSVFGVDGNISRSERAQNGSYFGTSKDGTYSGIFRHFSVIFS